VTLWVPTSVGRVNSPPALRGGRDQHVRQVYFVSHAAAAAVERPVWQRLEGAHRVLAVFARWLRLLQTEGEGAGSWFPRCVHELRNACVRVEGGVGVTSDV
jgi:hypothetical protein